MSSSSSTFPPAPESAAADISTHPMEVPSDDSEEVIENYLSDFLKRHNIGDSSAAKDVSIDLSAISKSNATTSNATTSNTTDAKVVSQRAPKNAEPTATPRIPSVAPESVDDLSTLRQLANSNARTALESHFFRQLIASSRRNLVFAVLASFFSIVLASLAAEIHSTAFMTAVVALVAAWVAAYRYLSGLRQMKRLREGEPLETRTGSVQVAT